MLAQKIVTVVTTAAVWAGVAAVQTAEAQVVTPPVLFEANRGSSVEESIPNFGSDGTRLFSTCTFADEQDIDLFLGDLAGAARYYNHDPDLIRDGDRLEIVTTTYDTGGLTELDFLLAREVELLLASRQVQCEPKALLGQER